MMGMDLTVRTRAQDATRPPVVVSPDDTLRTVSRQLWEKAVGAAVVADEHGILGVISERDVVAQLALGGDIDTATAREAMTDSVVSAHPDDPLLDVVFLMIEAAIRHVPVIDEAGRLAGMVSIRDLLRPLLIDNLGG
jgi:CBS domain-containing protein